MTTTITTTQAEVPTRAAAVLGGAICTGVTVLTSGRQIQHFECRPLADLLEERNTIIREANALANRGDTDAADRLMVGCDDIETTILEEPASSLDDVIAKLAYVAQLGREGLCLGRRQTDALALEAAIILAKAAAPGMALPEPAKGRWTFSPVSTFGETHQLLAAE